MDHWDIQYIPQALCYIYMPETFKGLWKQRLRWAQGGVEVLLEYIPKMFKLRLRRMWPVMLEALISIIWSYVMIMIFILFLWDCLWIYRNNFKLIHSCRSGMA